MLLGSKVLARRVNLWGFSSLVKVGMLYLLSKKLSFFIVVTLYSWPAAFLTFTIYSYNRQISLSSFLYFSLFAYFYYYFSYIDIFKQTFDYDLKVLILYLNAFQLDVIIFLCFSLQLKVKTRAISEALETKCRYLKFIVYLIILQFTTLPQCWLEPSNYLDCVMFVNIQSNLFISPRGSVQNCWFWSVECCWVLFQFKGKTFKLRGFQYVCFLHCHLNLGPAQSKCKSMLTKSNVVLSTHLESLKIVWFGVTRWF